MKFHKGFQCFLKPSKVGLGGLNRHCITSLKQQT